MVTRLTLPASSHEQMLLHAGPLVRSAHSLRKARIACRSSALTMLCCTCSSSPRVAAAPRAPRPRRPGGTNRGGDALTARSEGGKRTLTYLRVGPRGVS